MSVHIVVERLNDKEIIMPWTAQSGNTYQLVLLDTNALSDIAKNKKKEGLRFVTEFDAGGYAPCFTSYSLIEIRRNEEAYKSFLKLFSVYPIFILKPHSVILEDEKAAYDTDKNVSALLYSFSPSHDLLHFIDIHFSKPENLELEKNWKEDERRIMESWLELKKNFKATSDDANKEDAEKYVNKFLFEKLCQRFPAFVRQELDKKIIPDSDKFPSLQAILYSQYYRIFDKNRNCTPSDVTDVRIMAASPYVDVIITENYQAELFKKFKAKVPLLMKLRAVRVGDLRVQS
jgi:hypothetical protein